jgi:GTP-binding protein
MKITRAEFVTSVYPQGKYPVGNYPEVAFAGRSNVGKSSLINTLVNRKGLARTSTSPGKTQSINFYLINQAFHFVDLPGYGYARVPHQVQRQWSPLIEEYCRSRKKLRGVIVILDARISPTPLDHALIQWLAELSLPTLIVMTKMDKLSKNKSIQARRQIAEALDISPEVISPFSAHTGVGKKELWQKIMNLLDVGRKNKRAELLDF